MAKELTQKIALLSNVNMNFVVRTLKRTVQVYDAEGYGNELGILLNPASSYYEFAPDETFLVVDLLELLEHDLDAERSRMRIEEWFHQLESCLLPGKTYYVSDAYLWGLELETVFEPGKKYDLEQLWSERLEKLCAAHANVFVLPYRRMIETLGAENAFSLKMWYMGGILLSNEAQNRLAQLILHKLELQNRVPRKVLLLDLDNTLWGGLAGERDSTPILLAQDHGGLAYKNLQRVIAQMNRQGVLLGIVSKNNEEDALEVIRNHPHMVLREDCFAVKKINWEAKHENIVQIARELNLGTDSFVFWDDNPAERELVKQMLPEVAVPDFPDKKEELAQAMIQIYRDFFEKETVTREDLEKTRQYAENSRRADLREHTASFEEYLRKLDMKLKRVEPGAHIERLVQLVNKTNQFNLTTKRYSLDEMQKVLENKQRRVFLFQERDRFGDNGIVSAVIVNTETETPFVEEWVMSCRVMGKNLEFAVIEWVEEELLREGFTALGGLYIPTPKNAPVSCLYEQLGYRKAEEEQQNRTDCAEEKAVFFLLELDKRPERIYFVERER